MDAKEQVQRLERVPRKEYPEAYRELTIEEFMEYYGLGEEDMRKDGT